MIFAVDALAIFKVAHLAKGLNPDRLLRHHDLLCNDRLNGPVWKKAITTGDPIAAGRVAMDYCSVLSDLTQRSEEILNQIWETQPQPQPNQIDEH